jgi:hypothetical protein
VISTELETRALLGRNVTDTYGRNIGRIIGLERNHFGELDAVQVEVNAGQIINAKQRQLSITPSTVRLTPEWKLEAEDIIQELSVLHKRILALESLKNSGEIAGEIYAELLDAQKTGYVEKIQGGTRLLNSMSTRLSTIAAQISSLAKYLATAKLDHKSGILDESSFKVAEHSIEPTLGPLIAEKADITNAIVQLRKILER